MHSSYASRCYFTFKVCNFYAHLSWYIQSFIWAPILCFAFCILGTNGGRGERVKTNHCVILQTWKNNFHQIVELRVKNKLLCILQDHIHQIVQPSKKLLPNFQITTLDQQYSPCVIKQLRISKRTTPPRYKILTMFIYLIFEEHNHTRKWHSNQEGI